MTWKFQWCRLFFNLVEFRLPKLLMYTKHIFFDNIFLNIWCYKGFQKVRLHAAFFFRSWPYICLYVYKISSENFGATVPYQSVKIRFYLHSGVKIVITWAVFIQFQNFWKQHVRNHILTDVSIQSCKKMKLFDSYICKKSKNSEIINFWQNIFSTFDAIKVFKINGTTLHFCSEVDLIHAHLCTKFHRKILVRRYLIRSKFGFPVIQV